MTNPPPKDLTPEELRDRADALHDELVRRANPEPDEPFFTYPAAEPPGEPIDQHLQRHQSAQPRKTP